MARYFVDSDLLESDNLPMADERSPDNSTLASIARVREAWLQAVRHADVGQLGSLVSEDVVVVHGNGRCVIGKDALKADFRKGFEAFSVEQTVSSPEVVVRGRWAFEISEVASRLTHRSGESTQVHSTTVVALISNRTDRGRWGVFLGSFTLRLCHNLGKPALTFGAPLPAQGHRRLNRIGRQHKSQQLSTRQESLPDQRVRRN